MKKKFFALMMAMVMVLSLAACGGSDEADSNSGDSAGGEPFPWSRCPMRTGCSP